jgi:hypothetical protein
VASSATRRAMETRRDEGSRWYHVLEIVRPQPVPCQLMSLPPAPASELHAGLRTATSAAEMPSLATAV